MNHNLLIAGGGIGGLATALACARTGIPVTLLEQAAEFSEVGAGIQLGPNAVRVLADWGLTDALKAVAAFPEQLQVRDAHSGSTLGQLRLGARAVEKYGQPYATIHRADAHQMLLTAVQALGADRGGKPDLHLGQRLRAIGESADGVLVHTESGLLVEGGALVGADGLWSVVRQHVMDGPVRGHDTPTAAQEAPPRFSGQLAYRGMVNQVDLPTTLRTQNVTAWLGPRLHVVHYPVCGGHKVNVVAVVHGQPTGHPTSWAHQAHRSDLMQALGPVHAQLQGMLDTVPHWRLWPLNDRPPMTGAYAHAQGRVALLGDAAHPMRPYLAQGAAMALEDAWTLGQLLQTYGPTRQPAQPVPWESVFQRFAHTRWERNARVQAQSARNGRIFHAQGLVCAGRNLAMALGGERLLDNPWLYKGPPQP